MSFTLVIEGQVLTGKTTLCRSLGRCLDWSVIPEYWTYSSALPELPYQSDNAAFSAALQLETIEEIRLKKVRESSKAGVVVDRCIWSLDVIQFAHKRLGLPTSWRSSTSCQIAMFDRESVIRPDGIVILTVRNEVACSRELRRGKMIEFLMWENTRRVIHERYLELVDGTPIPVLWLDGGLPELEVMSIALDFAKELTGSVLAGNDGYV